MEVLSHDIHLHILSYLTYLELKEFAVTSEVNEFHVAAHMRHIIKMFQAKFPDIAMMN